MEPTSNVQAEKEVDRMLRDGNHVLGRGTFNDRRLSGSEEREEGQDRGETHLDG